MQKKFVCVNKIVILFGTEVLPLMRAYAITLFTDSFATLLLTALKIILGLKLMTTQS